jgi:hypothetical protein
VNKIDTMIVNLMNFYVEKRLMLLNWYQTYMLRNINLATSYVIRDLCTTSMNCLLVAIGQPYYFSVSGILSTFFLWKMKVWNIFVHFDTFLELVLFWFLAPLPLILYPICL